MKHIRTALFRDLQMMMPGDDVIVQFPTHFTAGKIVGQSNKIPEVVELSYIIDTTNGVMSFKWIGTEHDAHSFFIQYNEEDLYNVQI